MSKNVVADFIRSPYAWPGGYPLFAVTSDGASLCHKCCKDNYRQIRESMRDHSSDGWRVDAVDVNWEDADMLCDDCGNVIESAYGAD